MKSFKNFAIAATLLSGSIVASAATKAEYTPPYGMAGCGLGSLVVNIVTGADDPNPPAHAIKRRDGRLAQLLAYAINVYPLPQTFSITSGISNCEEATSDQVALQEQSLYIQMNLPHLQREAAQGQGERLATLADVMGCSNVAAFQKMSQASYSKIFTSSNSDVVVNNFRTSTKNSAVVCSRAG